MTFEDLKAHLQPFPPEAPLVFTLDDTEIRGGYHVTELKRATVTSIDCGGRTADWEETALQLLDGTGGAHMSVGTFRGILGKSLERIPALGAPKVHVEFAPGNIGMRIHDMAAPVRGAEGTVRIALSPARAQCKPFVEAVAHLPGAGCCGAGQGAQTCCG